MLSDIKYQSSDIFLGGLMNSYSKLGANDFKINLSKIYNQGEAINLSRYIPANLNSLVAQKSKTQSKLGTPRAGSPDKNGPDCHDPISI